jgi:hypothetical protein
MSSKKEPQKHKYGYYTVLPENNSNEIKLKKEEIKKSKETLKNSIDSFFKTLNNIPSITDFKKEDQDVLKKEMIFIFTTIKDQTVYQIDEMFVYNILRHKDKLIYLGFQNRIINIFLDNFDVVNNIV